VPEEGVFFATVNGLELGYFEHGSGPLVLMIHGFPDTPHTWDGIAEPVADAGFRVVTPWLRGYAPSEFPDGDLYTVSDLGGDVLGWIEALGEDSAILVGHDWGALSAYSAALLDPGPVEKLVTVAIPHPGFWEPAGLDFWRGRHFVGLGWNRAAVPFSRNDYKGVDKFFKRWSPDWEFTDEDTEPVKNCYAAPGGVDAALGFYRAFESPLPDFMLEPVSVPTWSFAGTGDLIDPAAYYKLQDGFTDDYTVIEIEGGHFAQRESTAFFIAELLAILADER
jgi:pimeloyl-ACP methyl ester carboxylesterase